MCKYVIGNTPTPGDRFIDVILVGAVQVKSFKICMNYSYLIST